MLHHQMDAVLAVQSSFHLNYITRPFPLLEKCISMISLSHSVHLLLFLNIIGMFQGPETKTCFA